MERWDVLPGAKSQTQELFEQHRGRLMAVAYRMLGSVSEAEDALQETFVRWLRSDTTQVESPRAWLTATVTRICIDRFRSARHKRETYIGPWLPEPVLTDVEDDLGSRIDGVKGLSTALLRIYETLTANERAVFLLHEVFDYDYAEIGEFLSKSPQACRQLARRARKRLHGLAAPSDGCVDDLEELTKRFMLAASTGDQSDLESLFSDDVVLWSDGGGKVAAARNAVRGRAAVTALLLGLRAKAAPSLQVHRREINGELGLLGIRDGVVSFAITFRARAGYLDRIYIVNNPDKLIRLEP